MKLVSTILHGFKKKLQIHINHKSRRISLSFPPNPTNFPFCVWVVYHFILQKMGVVNYEFWVFFTSHGLFYCRKTGRGFRDEVRQILDITYGDFWASWHVLYIRKLLMMYIPYVWQSKWMLLVTGFSHPSLLCLLWFWLRSFRKSLNWVCKEEALREGILIRQSGQGHLIFSCHIFIVDWLAVLRLCCLLRRPGVLLTHKTRRRAEEWQYGEGQVKSCYSAD